MVNSHKTKIALFLLDQETYRTSFHSSLQLFDIEANYSLPPFPLASIGKQTVSAPRWLCVVRFIMFVEYSVCFALPGMVDGSKVAQYCIYQACSNNDRPAILLEMSPEVIQPFFVFLCGLPCSSCLRSGAPSRFVDVILGGKLDALQHDLPELPELDNLFAPEVSSKPCNKMDEECTC